MQAKLFLTQAQSAAILDHVQQHLPEEACGMLGGRNQTVQQVIPITNELHSAKRFRMVPQEQLNAFLSFEAQGFEPLAFFHSHPTGPATPSQSDVDEFYYPGVLMIICSPGPLGWQMSAFLIQQQEVVKIPLIILDPSSDISNDVSNLSARGFYP